MQWVTYAEAIHTSEPAILVDLTKPNGKFGDLRVWISDVSGGNEDEFEIKHHVENRVMSVHQAIHAAEKLASELGINIIGVDLENDR